MKMVEGYFVCWNNIPQHGMWAISEEALREMLEINFEGIALLLKEEPDLYAIRYAQIIFNDESNKEPRE